MPADTPWEFVATGNVVIGEFPADMGAEAYRDERLYDQWQQALAHERFTSHVTELTVRGPLAGPAYETFRRVGAAAVDRGIEDWGLVAPETDTDALAHELDRPGLAVRSFEALDEAVDWTLQTRLSPA
jgi:hypothetical protein